MLPAPVVPSQIKSRSVSCTAAEHWERPELPELPVVQLQPVSIWQLKAQPSPPLRLPSSQISPLSITLLPQSGAASSTQELEQPSPLTVLPSSQSSNPSLRPLPQTAATSTWQPAEQPSPGALFRSSHCSTPALTKPSPQNADWQETVQESVLS